MEINWGAVTEIGIISGVSAILGGVIVWIIGMGNRISDMSISKSGLKVHTNSDVIVYELLGKLEHIDSEAKRKMRKTTESLTLMSLGEYGMQTDVIVVNLKSIQPLISATYENHITRELLDSGADNYIDGKIEEVLLSVQPWGQLYVDLHNLAETLVYRWVKRALIPNIRQACYEKLTYYKKLYKRTDIGNSLREEVNCWILKNDRYILRLDELEHRSGIREQTHLTKISSMITPVQKQVTHEVVTQLPKITEEEKHHDIDH